jgi:hypothetical protein
MENTQKLKKTEELYEAVEQLSDDNQHHVIGVL